MKTGGRFLSRRMDASGYRRTADVPDCPTTAGFIVQPLDPTAGKPRWPQKRPYVVTSKPAKGKRSQDMKLFYTNTAYLGKLR
jgi:hypothetical protein